MKSIEDLNLNQWFMARELMFVPKHFVGTSARLTAESRQWVLEKLIGRFSVPDYKIAFEDPVEATFFELTWG
jgi:hypothetical protein